MKESLMNPNLGKVDKTGLGSSASLVTSLVGCILKCCKVVNLPHRKLENNMGNIHSRTHSSMQNSLDLDLVHSVSQFCHCHAQGKIFSNNVNVNRKWI